MSSLSALCGADGVRCSDSSPMSDRISQLHSLLQSEPDDAFCMYGLAMEYAKTGDATRAVEWFDRVIEADADYLYAYFHKARTLADQGDIEGALASAQEGVQRARALHDAKAASELAALVDEFSD